MQPLDGFLTATDRALQALAGRYFPSLQAAVEGSPFEWSDLNAGQMAQAAEPEPLGVAQLLARTPYMSAAAARRQLDAAAERGLLESAPDGFRVSPSGRAFLASITQIPTAALAELEGQLPGVERLAELLGGQVAAICAAPGIACPALTGSRRFDPGPDASALQRLRRALIDLNSWRDDAHVAAWRAHETEGHAWEAFSHVWAENTWGDPIRSAAEAAEKLGSFRGYAAADYAAALDRLVARGWLESRGPDEYQLTEAGRHLRQQAETATDQLYFAPMTLSPAESSELLDHLSQLSQALDAA